MYLQGLKSASLALSLVISSFHVAASPASFKPRQLPAEVKGLKTITAPSGAQIRYKEPGKEAGICETTPDVNSYTGYIDLAPDSHTFFWFFEARHNPQDAPLTLWLNGGPGSDSLIGLFQGEPFHRSAIVNPNPFPTYRAWALQHHRRLNDTVEPICME